MPSQQSNSSVPSVVVHQQYYLPDGDLNILVESTMFKINSYFVNRDSSKFRRDIEAARKIVEEGKRPGSSSCPFKIDQASPDQFAKFLDIYYDTYSDRSTLTVQDWTGVLKIACAHDFPKIKHLATLSLETKTDLDLTERITLYREYGLNEEYLLPHILEIIKRDDYPTDVEEATLGDAVATLVSRARQNFLVTTGGRKISSLINNQTAEDALRTVPDAATIIPLSRAFRQTLTKPKEGMRRLLSRQRATNYPTDTMVTPTDMALVMPAEAKNKKQRAQISAVAEDPTEVWILVDTPSFDEVGHFAGAFTEDLSQVEKTYLTVQALDRPSMVAVVVVLPARTYILVVASSWTFLLLLFVRSLIPSEPYIS
ncbi:hypothetical protein CPB83DRAFT_857972 [Crepidotus variabilis]|uniref:BTB domain-containing protein n=1 Tax=Crepidotus variabilis TaxID=179855 RepID=A0A9P6EC42_9AGAR|nr:hypothetical protein CPB83DRAFT_857972 [Crepidotus variabilis]